eukprot:Clim_evm12s53 gene=Clim_evmTU12s53
MAANLQIATLLEKMKNSDKDFRFMAINDLMAKLNEFKGVQSNQAGNPFDNETEAKVVNAIVKVLKDPNAEVQNLAVKCLVPLAERVRDQQLESMLDSLFSNMQSETEQVREISSIGLKNVVSTLDPTNPSHTHLSKRLATWLCKFVEQNSKHVPILLDSMDILADLLTRFGQALEEQHPQLQSTLTKQMHSDRMAVRKRAMTALGALVMTSRDQLFNDLMEDIIKVLESSSANETDKKAHVQLIGILAKTSDTRVGKHIPELFPHILKFVQHEGDDELRESCIACFETLSLRCSKETATYTPDIIKVCLELLSYDPNYNYDDDDEDGGDDMSVGDDDMYDDDDDDEYSDDEDMSWKVRRACAKCLSVIISTRPDLLQQLLDTVAPVLVSRFKEREENVKNDIFGAYVALLRQTRFVTSQGGLSVDAANAMAMEGSPITLIREQLPIVTKSMARQLKDKSVKVKTGSFQLLAELLNLIPDGLDDHIDGLMPAIWTSLGDSSMNASVRLDVLSFFAKLITGSRIEVLQKEIPKLIEYLCGCIQETFYKTISEGLMVLTLMVRMLRPDPPAEVMDVKPFVPVIYETVFNRLKSTDIDQEVKERSIMCMARIMAHMGDYIPEKMSEVMEIFQARLENEITRLVAVRGVTTILESPLNLPIQSFVPTLVSDFTTFLRKSSRTLRVASLVGLRAIVGESDLPIEVEAIMAETRPLIKDSDLHLTQLSLIVIMKVISSRAAGKAQEAAEYPEILALITSPLLHGAALKELLNFYEALMQILGPAHYERLTSVILDYLRLYEQPVPRRAYHTAAQVVERIARQSPESALDHLQTFLNEIQDENSPDAVNITALYCIGEIGRTHDVSRYETMADSVSALLSSPKEEVKAAASFALGTLAAGNLEKYLPYILQTIEQHPDKQYLLLHSLKEVIISLATSGEDASMLHNHMEQIWTMLFAHSEDKEEGSRSVVAECLGKLTVLDPQAVLPEMRKRLKSDSPLMRATVISGIKYTITDQNEAIDEYLVPVISEFLAGTSDADIGVRRVGLVTLNSAAHNKPAIIRDQLPNILPSLYENTVVKPELIRQVEMGPFKHKVDDGLDIRKAAYECMYTLLDTCLDRIELFDFLTHVQHGLEDHFDVIMLCHLILIRIVGASATAVAQRLDVLLPPLQGTITSTSKASTAKQDPEKNEELIRSSMRAVLALAKYQETGMHPDVQALVNLIKSKDDLRHKYEAIQKDTEVARLNEGDGMEM